MLLEFLPEDILEEFRLNVPKLLGIGYAIRKHGHIGTQLLKYRLQHLPMGHIYRAKYALALREAAQAQTAGGPKP